MITWSPGKELSLQFDQLFSTEKSTGCRYDYLLVYEGISPYSPELMRVCGLIKPNDLVISSVNAVLVKFETDGSNNKDGFKINFVAVDGKLFIFLKSKSCPKIMLMLVILSDYKK